MRSTTAIITGRLPLVGLDRYIQYKADGFKVYILVSPDTAPSPIVPTALADRTNISRLDRII